MNSTPTPAQRADTFRSTAAFQDTGFVGPTPRSFVYSAIDGEREYQDDIGKVTSGEPRVHSVNEMLLFMEHYVSEARKTASTTWGAEGDRKTLDILRKITALGIAAMEQNGVVYRKGHVHTSGILALQPCTPAKAFPTEHWIGKKR